MLKHSLTPSFTPRYARITVVNSLCRSCATTALLKPFERTDSTAKLPDNIIYLCFCNNLNFFFQFSRMFSLSEPFKVYYIDDDEDEVLVTSDQDLAEALQFFQSQRAETGKAATCRFTIKRIEGKSEEASTEKHEETTAKPRSNAWADLAQNFVDHLEQEMSFIQGSAQSSASALAAAAASASQNWQRAFSGQSTQPSNATSSQSESTNVETQLHANVMCDQCYRAVRGYVTL